MKSTAIYSYDAFAAVIMMTVFVAIIMTAVPQFSRASTTVTPSYIQTFMMGGADGGGYDVLDQQVSLYMDNPTPWNTCNSTGSYNWSYADSFCNYANQTRYLTALLLTISYNASAMNCSTWSQWHTTSTSNGKLLASYGRPSTNSYSVSAANHPAYIGRMNGSVGWSSYYLYGSTALNGFMCEQNKCKTYFDCPSYELETTNATSNFYPLCTCSCLSGHAGQYCDVPLNCSGRGTLTGSGDTAKCTCSVAGTMGNGCQGLPTRTSNYTNAGGYNHEFTLYCEASAITYYTAKKRCDLADGTRFLATPYLTSQSVIQTLAGANTSWLGLQSYYAEANLYYYAGRFKNLVLTTGMTNRNASASMSSSSFAVRDMNKPLTCYVCEQQTCSITLDCVAANTKSVSGYYPVCKCVCKQGSSGSRCQRTGTMTLPMTKTQRETTTRSLPVTKTLIVTTTRSLPVTKTLIVTTTYSLASTHTLPTTKTLPMTKSQLVTTSHTLPPTRSQPSTKSALVTTTMSLRVSETDATPTNSRSHPPTMTVVSTTSLDHDSHTQSSEQSMSHSLPPTPTHHQVTLTTPITITEDITLTIPLPQEAAHIPTTVTRSFETEAPTTTSYIINPLVITTLETPSTTSIATPPPPTTTSAMSTTAATSTQPSTTSASTTTTSTAIATTLTTETTSPSTTTSTTTTSTTTMSTTTTAPSAPSPTPTNSTITPLNTTTGTTSITTTTTEPITSNTTTDTSATTTPTTSSTTTTSPTSPVPTCDYLLRDARLRAATSLFLVSQSETAIRAGINLTIPISLNASTTLLALGPVDGVRVQLVRLSVAGNIKGFAIKLPTVLMTVTNYSTIQLTTSGLPSYDIGEAEDLAIAIPTSAIVGSVCVVDQDDETVTVGVVHIWPQTRTSHIAVASTVIGAAAAVAGMGGMAGLAADQQGLSAFAMMGCSNPSTNSSFGSMRVLSPFAVSDSYAGVIIGNSIILAAATAVQVITLVLLRVCRRVRRQIELMATARFPALVLSASFAFHTGTAFAASQIVSETHKYASWEVGVGVIAFGYCVVYPALLVAHPYLRVGRAYQVYAVDEWMMERRWPAWARHIVPQGIMFSAETRRAYGPYVSSYRAPARQVWWTSYPIWTSMVVGIGGLFHPNTIPGCQALLCCLGVALMAIAAVTAWRLPHRSTVASILNAVAKALLGMYLFAMAAAVGGSEAAVSATLALGYMQIAVTVLRIAHTIICMLFDRRMRKEGTMVTTEWTHVTGRTAKSTHSFKFGGDAEELTEVVADGDDAVVDGDVLLLEIDDDEDLILDPHNSTTPSSDVWSEQDDEEEGVDNNTSPVAPTASSTTPRTATGSSSSSLSSNSTLQLSDTTSNSSSVDKTPPTSSSSSLDL